MKYFVGLEGGSKGVGGVGKVIGWVYYVISFDVYGGVCLECVLVRFDYSNSLFLRDFLFKYFILN